MSNSKFLKKLTAAEVGNTKTHEVYIRIPNDFDFESFFNNSHVENGSVVEVSFNAVVSTRIIDNIAPQSYDLRFVYFANSNKEKRIPGLGQLFKSFNVKEGDIVCLEKKEDNSYSLTFLSPDTLQIYNGGLLLNGSLEDSSSKDIVRFDEQPLQQIYFGAPGTGKSHRIKQACSKYEHYRITFHPDTDYASFVGSYKPITHTEQVYTNMGDKAIALKDSVSGEPVTTTKITYQYVYQAFLNAYIAAWRQQQNENPQPVFLVIEEINRGNCAQIFGDIFQLLDRNESGFSDYPIIADNDLKKELAREFESLDVLNAENINGIYNDDIIAKIKSGSHLLLPNNLYIWATMNTSDQSLFPIDSAFKRRWEWKYVKIADSGKGYRIAVNGNEYDWWGFVDAINSHIGSDTDQEDKKLGYFFAKAKKNDDGKYIISADTFLSKVIFFIYNDVFKDFGFEDDIFKDEDGQVLTFANYFDQYGDTVPEKVERFIQNLGLVPLKIENRENLEESIPDESISAPQTTGKYIINGIRFNRIAEAVQKVFDILGEKYTLNDIEKIVEPFKFNRNGCDMIVTEIPDNATTRFWAKPFSDITENKFYVSNHWYDSDFDRLKNIVDQVSELFPQSILKVE